MSDHINSRTARRKQQEAQQKKSPRKKAPKGLFKKILLAVVTLGLVLFLGGVGLFAFYASTAPDLDEELLKDPLTSNFATKDGEIFYKFGTEKREFVPYDEIPEQLRDAILATEDVRFFKHHGIDFKRLGGAVIANFRGGFGSQGASTLTQQVIKNSFLKNEKTLKRKAQEAWLAFKLEREYTKEEIFEMYFNKVLISGNRYGFGTGANYFYGKKASELELPEIALLAGMPQYPNGYNPYKHPERAEKRRNTVLKLMNRHGKITEAEMEAAKKVSVTEALVPEEQHATNSKYPAYVDAVLDELEKADLYDLLSEGVTVQTALDPKAQEAVESAINDPSYYESEEMEAGMTVLDTKTGAIVAIGGGRNYSGRNLNFAELKRQPGSSIKPVLSYGPAIEYKSWSTGQTVVDEPYKYKGTDKSINNADGQFHGAITMREALYNSRNIPAVKTFEEIGPDQAKKFANGLGLSIEKLYSSDALGGADNEFSTIDMAGAYAAFGNGGIYTKPHAVTKITMRDGKTEKNMRPDPVTAMKDSTAYMITDILRDVVTKGTGKYAAAGSLDIAGKTGTTNFSADTMNKNNYKSHYVPDTWFTGYTTEYTISTWGGYQKRKPITTYEQGRFVPQKLFRSVISSISSNPGRFQQPNSVEQAAIVKGSNPLMLASSFTPSNLVRTELFVRGTLPDVQEIPETIEIPSPSNLSAQFDANSNSIQLNWDYDAPDEFDDLGDPSFAVSVSVDGGSAEAITTTSDLEAVFSGAELGRTYTFSVTATMGGYTSSPASTTLLIEGADEPEVEEPDDGQDDEQNIDQDNEPNEDDFDQGNQGNQNNQGNQGDQGNQGNQGNQNNQGQGNQGQNGQGQGNQGSQGNQNDQSGQGNQGQPSISTPNSSQSNNN